MLKYRRIELWGKVNYEYLRNEVTGRQKKIRHHTYPV